MESRRWYIYEWSTAVAGFFTGRVPDASHSSDAPNFTYRALFGNVCGRACGYLRRHLDDLFTLLMFSNVKQAQNLFRATERRVRTEEFRKAVAAAAEEAVFLTDDGILLYDFLTRSRRDVSNFNFNSSSSTLNFVCDTNYNRVSRPRIWIGRTFWLRAASMGGYASRISP